MQPRALTANTVWSTTCAKIMTAEERTSLERYARARAGRADLAQRARVMLLLAAGASYPR